MLNKIKMALGTSLMDSLIQGHPLECSICLERMKDVSHLITTPDKYGSVCDHYFCTKCIEPIVDSAKQKNKDPQCPTCRRVAVGVTRSRIANDMIQEIDKEREERKLVIQQKEDLQRLFAKTEEDYKQELDDLREQLEEQREMIKEGMEEEMEKIKEDQKAMIKKLKKQNKKLSTSIEHLKADLTTKENQNQELLDLVEQHRLVIEELRNKPAENNSEELLETIEQLKSEIDELKNEHDAEKREMTELIQKQQSLLQQLQNEKSDLEEQSQVQSQSQNSELRKLKAQIETIPSLESKIEELTLISQDLVSQLHKEREKFENEKRTIKDQLTTSTNSTIEEMTLQLTNQKQMTSQVVSKLNEYKTNMTRDLTQIQEQLQAKSEEAEKWQRMYMQLREDKTREMAKDQKADASYLSSWLTPINKLSNPLSYIKWAPTRNGRLIRSSNDIKFIERRGATLNGSVWKAIEKGIQGSGERTIALKKMNTQLNTLDAFRECFLLDRLDHNHILKVESVIRDVPFPGSDIPGDFMILPFYSFDLEFLMSDGTKRLSRPIIRYIMYQILSALYYLHSAELVHRDLKPTSILLDENFHVTLGGFTYARSLLSGPHPKVPITRYSAPENLYDIKSDQKAADIWSLGVLFAELLLGNCLFERNLLLSQILNIKEIRPSLTYFTKFPSLNNVSGNVSIKSIHDKIKGEKTEMELLLGMLVFEPEKRMNALQALQSMYFVEGNLKDVHKSCGFANELTDEDIPRFVNTHCGGL